MTTKTGSGPDAAPFALELRGVSKSFGLIRANHNINLQIMPGSIHGIIGENGAGKSTLMNIVYGMHPRDEGDILISGEPVDIRSSADAIGHGLGMVHQHFMLVPTFTGKCDVGLRGRATVAGRTRGGAQPHQGAVRTL